MAAFSNVTFSLCRVATAIMGIAVTTQLTAQADEAMGEMNGMDMGTRPSMMHPASLPQKGSSPPQEPSSLSSQHQYSQKHHPRRVHKAVDAPMAAPMVTIGGVMPVMDQARWFHGLLNEFEGRYQSGGRSSFRWDGDLWYGSDYNRLWIKSEGTLTKGKLHDGTHEFLYSRALSSYFNLQTGVRLDIDSGPTRPWGTIALEGLALYQFDVRLAGYVSGRGVAARLEGSYDILLTNRLILQPQVELSAYSQSDPRRGVGSGLSDIDTGLRLRYELWRKVAPYVAVTYDSPLYKARRIARQQGDERAQARFTFGIRSWF